MRTKLKKHCDGCPNCGLGVCHIEHRRGQSDSYHCNPSPKSEEGYIQQLKKQAEYIGGKDFPYAVVDIRKLESLQSQSEEGMDWEKGLTAGEVLRWSDKHQKLTSEGARLIHIQQLLKQGLLSRRQEDIERIKESIKELPTYVTKQYPPFIKVWELNQLLDSLLKGQDERT